MSAYPNTSEDIYAMIHRKEHEMKALNKQHSSPSDPVRMALGYTYESKIPPPLKLAKALRRVYDDIQNPAHPNYVEPSTAQSEREAKLLEYGMKDTTMRRGCFVVDIKRKSPNHEGEPFCYFDDASKVADAMASLGADVLFVNVDFHSYGGDLSELKSTVRTLKESARKKEKAGENTVAVVMKDVVVDEIQLGLAKEAGADGILLMASVLGPALGNFLDQATCIGLETIVECHTREEVQLALDSLAQNIMVSNYDRIGGKYHKDQAYKLAGMFPGSGGPIITLAGGGVSTVKEMKRLLAVGYDAVVVGRAVMGSTMATDFINGVRERTFLPAEFSQWGLEHVDFDSDGNLMP